MAEGSDKQRNADGLLRWPGLMTDMSVNSRLAAIVFLAVAACAMVGTQTNYFVVGDAHLIAVLAPITACALLYGPIPATIVGALAGACELIHARFLPLDVYEMYFAAPTNSVFLFAFMGLAMGLMYALASRRTYRSQWQGMAALIGACAIGSVMFTFLFSVSVNVINALSHLEIPHEIIADFTNNKEVLSQILANFGLMAILATAAGFLNRYTEDTEGTHTLRETFQSWLTIVIAIAYLFTMAIGYTAISAICRGGAEQKMQGQVEYLSSQLAERDKLFNGIQRRTQITDTKIEELHDSSIGGVATQLPLSEHGITAVAENGTIVSANVDSYVGQSFEEVVGSGLTGGFSESLYSQTRSTQWYIGGKEIGFLRAAQIGYVRVSRSGNYQIMAAMPASDVFEWRGMLMGVTSAIFVLVFIAVYTQASLLLKNVVVRGIDETNETLALITEGDLDQQVNVSDSVEFTSLSSGINATVAALKRAIVAEGARIERDLSTAKAIQESSLPQTFPPFPEVNAFDIYASMNAAREVGGDFYDFFLIDDHTLGFLIADVSGKGIPAALFMMAAKTELANYMGSGMDLSDAIQSANWHLCQGNEAGMFVTVWAATLDYQTGKLTYVNAGHNPPLLRRDGKWQWLRTKGGLFLGTFDTAKYRSSTLTLKAGDQLLLYTDGVNEAFSADEEQYGDLRLERFLSQHTDLHPHPLIDTLRADLGAWAAGAEQSDDITMLSLEYGVPPEATGTITVPATLDHLNDVFDLIHGELARRLCPISAQNQLDVAIEELFVNVCNYAYADSDTTGVCRVDYVYHAGPSTMTVQITDWGTPFDPLLRADPTRPASIQEAKIGGLGILMAKRMTDDISYIRDGDANVIAFKKQW